MSDLIKKSWTDSTLQTRLALLAETSLIAQNSSLDKKKEKKAWMVKLTLITVRERP